MKKIILLIFSLLFIIGCTKKNNNVITIIKENDNCLISINYPQTESNKLNKELKKEIKTTYKNFKKKHCNDNSNRTELNIDFKHTIINNKYINVILKTNYNKKTDIKTYIFNLDTNKKINIYNIFTENDLNILIEKIKSKEKQITINNNYLKKLPISFDTEYLYIYQNNKETLKLPIDIFDLKIKIYKEKNKEEKYTYKEINKTIDPNQKVIALTFDDGPSKYTKQIIDLLNKYDANATFFILGNKVEIYNQTLKYLLESGNEIGNHSYNHKWLTHVTNEELINQINNTQNIIKKTLDYTPTLFRPTYGSVNKKIRENTNLDIVLWNIDSLDWKLKNSTKIANETLKKIKDGKIILMHDTYEYTYNALKTIIPELKKQGYQIITISELKEVEKIRNESK